MKSFVIVAALAAGLLGATFAPPTAVASLSSSRLVVVHIHDFTYDPATVTVTPGETVEWINEDSAKHTASASDGTWKSGDLGKGQSWKMVFEKAGSHAYYCAYHRGMRGSVVVK
jgi:plastocyanin